MRALYAVDLEEAEEAVATGLGDGRRLLERLGATVDLLFVDPYVPIAMFGEGSEEVDQLLATALERRHSAQLVRLGRLLDQWPAERRGEARLAVERRPSDEIVAQAAGYDLVVVGTHARRGLSRAWVGSVAEKVVRSSPVPVLVVHRPAPPQVERADARLLVAVDVFGDDAPAIVADAGRWAGRLRATVDAVYVVSTPFVTDPSVLAYGAAWATEVVQVERDAQARLSALVEALPTEVRGQVRVDRGEAAATVADLAGAYLVVLVRTHGRHGMGRLWLGSVAERIVRTSAAPVLVLPPARSSRAT